MAPDHVPNPKRVAAGRRNRARRRPLGESSRLLLREAALRTRPWERATGPRTKEGKLKAADNLPRKPAHSEPAPTFMETCQRLLMQLRNFRTLEVSDTGPQFIVGLSEAFFDHADRFVRQQAEQEMKTQRDYLESMREELKSMNDLSSGREDLSARQSS